MNLHFSNCIYRKLLFLLTLLLVSAQMVLAQQDSTVDTEPKVYGNVYDGKPYYAESYESGDGSKDKPYLISNDMQLAKLAHDVNNGVSFSGKYFKLTKDIDLSKALWTPIGVTNPSKTYFFDGKFDGDGHTINNMHIVWTYDSGNEISVGLFSRLRGGSATETSFATVTNLTVNNARIEKKAGHTPKVTGTIKIGIIAADLTQNAEISNIIIRNSIITDNEEAYTLKNKLRIGGIVGYLDAFKYLRIYNISADTKIDMLSAATLNGVDKQASVSGGIGAASNLQPQGTLSVWPTNIYVHSTKINTNANSAKCIRGSVVSFIGNDNFSNSVKNTWFFTPTNKVSGTNSFNYGTEVELNSFGKTFTEIANAYINDNKLDRKTWAYSATSNSFAFSSIALKMVRGKEDVLTVVDEDGNAMKDVYDWYVSHGNAEPVKVNTDKLNPFSLPRQTYAQSVYATDGNSTTNTLIVNPITLSASLTTSKSEFTVNVTNDSEEHLSNYELGLDITYEWYNGTERLTSIPTSQNIVTRPTDTSAGRKYYCKVTVKSGSSVLLEKYVNVSVVVYLCPTGVTTSDGKTYAKGTDNLTDDSWGYTPDKPMLTWKGAYSKLSAKGSWDENTIVLMGTSSSNTTLAGFCLTQNYKGESLLTYDDWANAKRNNPQLFRNTTITGKWDKDYEGKIEIWGASKGLPIWGDTRFENLTFAMNGGDSYKIIYCQYNNILMDEGIRMTGFSHNSPDYGTIDGAVTNALHIFGGINNDGRFYPLNNADSIASYNKSMPHGKEGFSISVKSGFYSCISAGGRQSVTTVKNNGVTEPAKQNGIMGTPQQPIKCTIDIDIDRTWNDRHNEERLVTMNDSTKRLSANDYDAGVILAGNHEGAMYADVDIIIRSGKVARVVNGTLGAQTELTLPYDDKTYNVPCNTFMGRANITLDPSSSVNNKDEYTDKRVIITELYGGSTGRGHTGNVVVNNPFYGISTVTINGGTFQVLPEDNKKKDNILCGIFGAGAGGMNGIGYGDDAADTHTPDDRIPYWNDSKDVMLYGPYSIAKDRLVTYSCYNTDTQDFREISPKDTRSEIIINGGEFGYASAPIDGIYGGGSGFMSKSLWTKQGAKPSQYGGNVYGNGNETDVVTSLTINGGEFYCEKGVFAGGRGTDYFFSTNAYGGSSINYKELGKTYGNVELTINGGIFHCPVFGGGYGVADAKQLGTKNVETLSRMARVYGKSDVNIQGGVFFNNVYGGGDMAVVENRGADATNVVIGNNADIRGSVFAGGNGRRRRPATQLFAADDNMTQRPDSVGLVIGNANVSLIGSAEQAPYVYGDIFGGGNLAQVSADTYVSIYAGNMAGQIFGGGNGYINGDTITSADVLGNTNVMLAQDEGSQDDEDIRNVDNSFSINVIWNRKWSAEKNLFYVWDADIKESTDEPEIEGAVYKKDEFFANGKFLNPHNIYGGGNLACNVAGRATVLVQKGMTPYELLMTDEWKQTYTDNDNPHFSVFGGGYGQLTKVGSTDVTVNVDGDYGKYDTEVDDNKQMAPLKSSESGTFATHTERYTHSHRTIHTLTSNDTHTHIERSETTLLPVFDNSMGIPNFTVWGVLGGGYAGTVSDSTKVTVDGKTFVHRVFGGGFGDPASTKDNTTGQIGGKTEVYVCGARIHGDVFGGGAGLKPTTPSSDHFVNVARVVGTTKVDISDDAMIYGNVYGGGDNANVGEYVSAKPSTYYSTDSLRSITTLNQTDGTFISYEAVGYRSFVNISGGTVFGEVYGGGKGLTKAEADHYYNVGRINGNTLVHITDSKPGNYTDKDNIVPYVWSNVYGGCAYGTVDGNTLVHVEGGMLGNSVFGGGYGDVRIDNKENPADEVLGRKDTDGNGTYANILGNTKVQMDGGTWIWNRKADLQGNITTWTSADADSKRVCNNKEDFMRLVLTMVAAQSLDSITDTATKEVINRIRNDKNTSLFFDLDRRMFANHHNIFGGGNRACKVGTTGDNNTGKAVVIVNHSPLEDLKDSKGKTISLFDITSLQGMCWYLCCSDASRPQFSVFGAGYGANTEVGKTEVYAQPGTKVDDSGVLTIDGIKYRYLCQNKDLQTYLNLEYSMVNDFQKVSKEEKMLYYGSYDGSGDDPDTFRRYHASRLAWMTGASGLTLLQINGGGFAGYVSGDTYVETDCQLTAHDIYGAGLGALPYGDYADGSAYDFGTVKGKSTVFVKAGTIEGNIYGGGAGVESAWKNGAYVDFPDMARVEKTEVHLYGKMFTYKSTNSRIDRTLVLGSVYGGGDVANVGSEKADPATFSRDKYANPSNRTTLVNIRGGAIMDGVFAGGKGRSASKCADYKRLGGIYGNTCLIIDRPVMHYPYWDDKKKQYLSPSDDANMAHPADDNNRDVYSYFMERIYGGCQNGTVYGNTLMTLYYGSIGHGIYGGGLGSTSTADVEGKSVLTTTSADVTGNTNVFILGGNALLKSYWRPRSRSWEPASIIDGVTYSPQYDHEKLKFKINHNIYAGGNVACKVGGNTYLTMTKGLLHDYTELVSGRKDKNFFESNEWREIYEKVGSPHFCVFGGGYGDSAIVVGDTYVNVDMGSRGSNHSGMGFVEGEEYKHFLSGYAVMDIMGGGYSGKVIGDTHIVGSGGLFCRRMFGGGSYSSVRSTDVEIKAVDCHDVFGGGFMGDVLKATTVRIGTNKPDATATLNNSDIYIHGNIYGGNDVSGYVNVVLNKDGYFKDNGGTGTNIQIFGGHIYGDVYGAGNGNYLYANDRNGNKKVTVNEYYPLNPDDPKSETVPLVYTVPMRSTMPSLRAATDAVKMVNINSWRPLTNKVSIHINGTSASDTIRIDGNVYGGGNSATVQKVLAYNDEELEDSDEMVGDVSVNIGSHVRIGGVFMGCNGDDMFVTSEDNDYMNMFQKLNGDLDDHSKELNLADSIDWTNDPANINISTVYLPTENSKRPLVYPHLIDLYFQPVETDIQGNLTWNGSVDGKGLEDCIIGTFCCGGNRGNMNVMPLTAADNDRKIGNVVDYVFPEGLTITEKIVGGCNNANYDYKGKAFHEGGYLLGIAHSIYPFINLTIRNRFQPKEKDGAYMGGNVYGGCFKSGTIRGDVTINMQSDMLSGKEKAKLEKANSLLTKDAEYSALNVYGAGYGMESYVYGNTGISFGDDVKCSDPQMDGGKFLPCGVSANFVYGGGQQGNVIGVTNVDILNGHVFRAVTGGSYSGYVFGSTQVKVGYPTYYHVNSNNNVSGRYVLNRTDQKNLHLENNNGTEKTSTIKQNIWLLTDELVSQGTYDDIVAIDNGKRQEITEANKDRYFTKVVPEEPSVGWDNVHINIDEAVYGGGYSIAQGSSVLANNTTVLKFTDVYNADKSFTSEDELEELKHLPNGTTAGFGGNTLILIGDNKSHEHITISRQEMKAVKVSEGTDLYGYYYKHYDNDEAFDKNVYTYRYISLQDKYFYKAGTTPPSGLNGIRENVFYEYDSEGGIFGDGHLSYAQGFRSADVTGYGFAEHTIDNPKILNTFQRLDIIRLEDNCFSLLGARDYTVNEINKTPYSISRVGEIKMVADDILLNANGNLEAKADNDETFMYHAKARNYMGFSNNIHYVSAVTSNVSFGNDKWHNRKGELASASYQDVKQKYIDDYHKNKDKQDAADPLGEFQKRNDGTAKNMIGIASGYAMKIQLCQDTYDEDYKKVVEKEHYGPIYGVVEMNLINVRQDEGGGYVYADNNHKRHEGDSHKEDFLETTGNFVFPYHKGRYIVDDCFPTGYYTITSPTSDKTVDSVKVHYWYVTGFHYYYNVNITGYTYQSSKDHPLEFDSDNKDGLTVLSGLKSGQKVRIQTWKMRSGHPADKDEYSSDLEYRNYLTGNETDETDRKYYSDKVTDGYRLYVGGAATNSFGGARTEEDADKAAKGFAAQLSMREKGSNETTLLNNTLPAGLKEDAKIAFKLVDMVDNTNYVESGYYDKHLSKKSLATLVIKAPAYEEYVSDTDNKPIYASTGKLYKKTADGYVEVTSGKLDADNTYYQPQTEEFVKVDSLFMYDTNSKKYEKISNIADITIDENNPIVYYVPREYTYTIYLTIEYVQGPTVSGHINVGNCVLPGEMIRVTKDDLVVNADQSFAVSGYYWRIGKREKAADGTWSFTDTTPWTKENIKDAVAKGYDTFNQADEKGSGLFTGCHYDKTDDYLDIPAYYYMNGYGIQLGVAITGVNDIMQINMQEGDRLTVHNYHRMDPHKAGINLHLAEAIKRAKEEGKAFAEPRIYIADQSDLKAFAAFVDSIGNDGTAPRYGANAQFVLQDNLDLTATPKNGAYISEFAGILHGNGHIINGVGSDNALFGKVTGNIYNLGLSSGRLSGTTDENVKPNYHCCFEYAPNGNNSTPVVYRWDGSAYKGYTRDDFRLGRVAYDLNEYYLLARNKADKDVLKYVADYYANGDYQYACRTDAITGKNTGITYLRIGKLSDIPNYEQVETRHDKTHPTDAPRLVTEDRASHYVPLFNDNKNGTELMNDYLFWGQSLQSEPEGLPSTIASHQLSFMSNRVYRTAAYYGSTALDAFHYNAYSQGSSSMNTYVHDNKTTAIDFTCKGDLAAAMGMTEKGIFYPPVDDNATVFSDFRVKDGAGITQNLLVYTADDNTGAGNEAYDVVKNTLGYEETTRETLIKGHHVVKTADDSYATSLLHLVERTSDNENSEGEQCLYNDLCVPIAFNVTDRAWYLRKPMAYAEDYYGAWEGICLPFTADKTVASLNGEITHFYGSPSAEETADPKQNIHTLHHEYWLRSLTSVGNENGKPSAVFQRPDKDAENGVNYTFNNTFFIDNYSGWLYNKNANPYYAEGHEYPEYPRLTAEKPYIVRFPGERYYEFDLSSAFHNKLLGKTEDAQTIAFNAYGKTQNGNTSYGTITVPVTKAMQTVKDGYAHNGTFAAVEVSEGKVYGINKGGTAFDDASALSTVMPFRTYMSVTTNGATASPAYSSLINISELKGGTISPDAMDDEDNAQNDGIIVRPIGGQRVRVESTVRTRMNVVTAVGQLYRILDVQPGTATYSGFQPGLYIFGKTKLIVK